MYMQEAHKGMAWPLRIYIFEYRPMSTHTGTHHASRPDSDLCLAHLHKYPDPQVRFPTVLPTGKPMKIHGLPRVATCLRWWWWHDGKCTGMVTAWEQVHGNGDGTRVRHWWWPWQTWGQLKVHENCMPTYCSTSQTWCAGHHCVWQRTSSSGWRFWWLIAKTHKL